MSRPVDPDDASDPTRVTTQMRVLGRNDVAQPLTLRAVLESFKAGDVSIDEAETTITVLAKAGRGSRWHSGTASAA